MVYMVPRNQNNVGVLDTQASTFSTISTTGDAASGTDKYHGAAVVGATVYFASSAQNNVGILTLPTPAAGITGDPHLKGAHGDEADFKGDHRAVYNALSARNLSLNLLVEHDVYRTPFSKLNVRGSWNRAAFHTLRTSQTGHLVQVFFHAIDPHRAIITEGRSSPDCRNGTASFQNGCRVLTEDAPPFALENIRVSLHRKVLTVSNGQWRTSSESTVGAPHPRTLRMNVEVKPTYAVDNDLVAPHGLIGQTYDRDNLEVNGRRDDYTHLDDGRRTASRTGVGGDVTTKAKAEGAIEGTLDDYRVRSNFATAFRFSRFDAHAARPRNVRALRGQKGGKHEHSHPRREQG